MELAVQVLQLVVAVLEAEDLPLAQPLLMVEVEQPDKVMLAETLQEPKTTVLLVAVVLEVLEDLNLDQIQEPAVVPEHPHQLQDPL
jgi:hypothetical protein